MNANRQKVLYVETLRGLACLLLVSFHVVGSDLQTGMALPDDHYLHFVMGLFGDLRMPLFSFISGYIFYAHVAGAADVFAKVARKFRRLIIPMISIGTIYWMLQANMGIEATPYLSVLIEPYMHLWFLPAIFWIMACFYLAALLGRNRTVDIAVLLLVVGAFVWLSPIAWEPSYFSSYLSFYLMPFFMAGYLCANSNVVGAGLAAVRNRPNARAEIAAVLGALLVFQILTRSDVLTMTATDREIVSVAVGMIACTALFAARPVSSTLAYIGKYAYGIFLFHVLFTSGLRRLVDQVWIGAPDLLVLILGTAFGIFGSIALIEVVLRSRFAALAFLGIQTGPGPSPVPRAANRG